MILPMAGDEASGWKPGRPTAFLKTPSTEHEPTFSPDGHWLAYSSNETGRQEVYVRPFPGPGGQWQISTGGGAGPTWSRAKPELFYGTPNGQIMVVPFTGDGDSFLPEKPQLWSTGHFEWRGPNRAFDLHLTASDSCSRLLHRSLLGRKRITSRSSSTSSMNSGASRRPGSSAPPASGISYSGFSSPSIVGISSETVGWMCIAALQHGVRRLRVHHVEDRSGSTSSPLDAENRRAEDLLRVRVDDDLHEAVRLALLDGAADARHRPLADQRRPADCAPAPRSCRRVRAADRCTAR